VEYKNEYDKNIISTCTAILGTTFVVTYSAVPLTDRLLDPKSHVSVAFLNIYNLHLYALCNFKAFFQNHSFLSFFTIASQVFQQVTWPHYGT
jgi:hypothetical protein